MSQSSPMTLCYSLGHRLLFQQSGHRDVRTSTYSSVKRAVCVTCGTDAAAATWMDFRTTVFSPRNRQKQPPFAKASPNNQQEHNQHLMSSISCRSGGCGRRRSSDSRRPHHSILLGRHGSRVMSTRVNRAGAAAAVNAPPSPAATRSKWTVDPYTGLVSQHQSTTATALPSTSYSYQVKVGLELHAQLNIDTKLFSPARSSSSSSLAHHVVPPNTAVHPYDVAVPGFYPVLASRDAIQCALLIAGALQCRDIPTTSRFERKHYVYADLPHGYQITQQRWPLARNGLVTATMKATASSSSSSSSKNNSRIGVSKVTAAPISCRINRIQLEQDTGKTTTTTTTTSHSMPNAMSGSSAVSLSRVDLNRAGVALVEIVTEPDLRSSVEAGAIVQTIQQLLQHSRTSLARMQLGELRVDVNVNIVPVSQPDHDTTNGSPRQLVRRAFPRVEVKNLNSIQHVQDCIQYEAMRQVEILEDLLNAPTAAGDQPLQLPMETRTWNASVGETELIRYKHGDEDYRFLPEPDMPPIVLNEHMLERRRGDGTTATAATIRSANVADFIQAHLPESPPAARARIESQYGLSDYLVTLVTAHVETMAFFEAAAAVANAPLSTVSPTVTNKEIAAVATLTANLLCNELFALVKKHNQPALECEFGVVDVSTGNNDYYDDDPSVEASQVTPQQLGMVVRLVQQGQISNTMAKSLLSILYTECERNACPQQVVRDRNLMLIADRGALQQLCQAVIAQHADELEVYRRGGKFITKMQKLFTGKVMAASKGQAHPERLQEVLVECLERAATVTTSR